MSSEDRNDNDPLESLIASYLEAEKSGQNLNRDALIEEYPELADSLRDFFANHDRIKAAADQEDPTLPANGSDLDDETIPPHPNANEDSTIPPQGAEEDRTIPPTEPASPTGASVGDQVRYFGDYELLEEIARGGMGVVFKARQINLNRIVALKMILSGEFAGEEDVKRFHTEAEAAAQLDHPGIVPIFEIGEHQGQHYFSMGFVEGESLAQNVADGPLPPREAAELVRKICEAMSYAHERGVIHRDLKPANILIDQNGQPKLTDFGLAKKTQADSNLTGTGQILGTPAYMPPEQASGKIEEVGPLADVYSLGAVLYCLLSGRPPFQAASPMDTLLQVLERDPISPSFLVPSIPPDLETICLKCLEKARTARYSSVQELKEELGRFLEGKPIVARPISRQARVWRWCRRNPWPSASIVTLGLLVVVTLASIVTLRSRLWDSLVQQARVERLAGRRWQSLERIREAAQIKSTATLRAEAIETITSTGSNPAHEFASGVKPRVAFSLDGKILAIGGQERFEFRLSDLDESSRRSGVAHTARFFQLPSANLVSRINTQHRPSSLAIGSSSSSSLVALEIRREIKLLDLSSSSDFLNSIDASTSPVFARDGSRLAYSTSGKVRVWNFETASEEDFSSPGKPCCFFSDGSLLVKLDDQLKSFNIETGAMLCATPDGLEDLSYSVTDDTSLAALYDPNRRAVVFWDMGAGRQVHMLREIEKPKVSCLSGNQILFAYLDPLDSQILKLVDLSSDQSAGRLLFSCPSGKAVFGKLEFSPNSRLLVAEGTTAGTVVTRVIDVESGSEVGYLADNYSPVWNHNGSLLATVGPGCISGDVNGAFEQQGILTRSGYVNVWNIVCGVPTYFVSERIGNLCFSSDGKQLFANSTNWKVIEGEDEVLLHRQSDIYPGRLGGFTKSGMPWAVDYPTKLKWGEDGYVNNPVRIWRSWAQPNECLLESPNYSEVKPEWGSAVRRTVRAVSVSPTGDRVIMACELTRADPRGGASGTGETTLELWSLDERRRLGIWNANQLEMGIRGVQFSPDGTRVAVCENGISIWDVANGSQLHSLHRGTRSNHVVFSPDGEQVFSVTHSGFAKSSDARDGPDSNVLVGDAESGKSLAVLEGHKGNVNALVVSPDGQMLATGGQDQTIRLWEVKRWGEIARWKAHGDTITALAFSPDSRTLVSSGDDGIMRVWSIPSIRSGLRELDLDW